MNLRPLLLRWPLFASLLFLPVFLSAQTTVTVNCTGTTGSYKSGSVTSTGTKADGNMSVNNVAAQSTPRGWAVFDLSGAGIPAGATITAASLSFSYTTTANGTGVSCALYGYAGDLSTLTGTTLYSTCVNGTAFNTTNWGANQSATPTTITKAFNATGISFIQNNYSNTLSISFVASSGTNQYTITGYGGTAALQPQLSITYTLACNGTPNAGTAASTSTSVCSGVNFTLSLTGNAAGSGIGIQWESSAPNANSWTPISGATNASYTVTGGQTTATDYHAVITCSNGGATATTNTVSVAMASFYNCYCTSRATNAADDDIFSVTVNGNTNAYNCTTVAPGPGSILKRYSNFTTLPALAQLSQGLNSSFTILEDECDGSPYYDNGCGIWIDFDHSGTFDATEQVFIENATVQGPRTITGNITVPVTSLTGITGMRIVLVEGIAGTGISACGTYTYGETEDYLVDIIPANQCNGTPVAGMASGPSTACLNVPFNLSASGYPQSLGISLQWQSAPAGTGNWTPIAGATDPTYTVTNQTASTDYQLLVTCANGGGSASTNTLTVTQNPPTNCYCTPVYITGCSDDDDIHTLTLAGENGTSLNNPNTGCATNAYDNKTSLVVQLAQGLTYSGTMSSQYGTSDVARIWIDFGDDGVFDAADEVGTMADVPTTAAPYSITIPATAALGSHRMRVRLVYDPTGAIDPCSSYDYGETHDYTALIVLPPTCPTPTAPTAGSITATSASLGWTNTSSATTFTIEYGPQGFTPGTGTFVTATSNPFTLGFLQSNTAYSFYVRAICSPTDSSLQSVAGSFNTLLINDIPSGAIPLTVNGGCTGLPYTNQNATQSTNEPFPGCRQTAGFHSVWFSFTAPASGFVRVTNDYTGATIGNTRIGVFTATDVNDFATFNIIACDANNGSAVTGKSLLYVNGLTPNAVYYVEVDGLNSTQAMGTFCVTVDEVTSAMLAAGGACAAGKNMTNLNNTYRNWLSLVDASGKLIVNVRQTNAASTSPTAYGSSLNVNTGGVRQAGTQYYLDRNYLIGSTGATTSPSFEVQLFFLATEQSALNAVDANATPGGLNVTHQSGSTCQAAYSAANGTNTVLTQTGNGSVNGISWIQATTPGFSNFYIMSGNVALAVKLGDITAVNQGSSNLVSWHTLAETAGDIFLLQRSTDGRHFTQLEALPAKGHAADYTYTDTKATAGINYYRLAMRDAAGALTYSKVVTATVTGSNTFGVAVFPNPVTDILTVQLSGTPGDEAQVTLTDVTGQRVLTQTMTGNECQVDMSRLASGIYLLQYRDNHHARTLKLTRQ